MNAESDLTLDHFNDDSALIYGIGNIGRQDDGLGWAFVDWLETTSACANAEKVKFYQLNLEDADLISHKQRVLFVDASKDTAVNSFRLYKAESKMDFSFTSHSMSIETIMATCQMCFGKIPEVYVLAIRGYEWELQIGLTEQAKRNLDLASTHIYRTAAAPSPKTDCCLQQSIAARNYLHDEITGVKQ